MAGVKIAVYVLPEPLSVPIEPFTTVTSPAVKVAESSLRVNVTTAVWPCVKAVRVELIVIVGTL